MQCEKCGGTAMQAVKRFRMSGCLVSAGFALGMTSLIAVAAGVLLVAVGPQAARQATATHDARAHSVAIKALEGIPGLPHALVQELESTGKLSEETIGSLPLEQRSRVRTIMIDYYGSRVASGAGGAIGAGVGVFLILVLFAFGIPGAIVGLLLVRRRKLWRCGSCGFAFERT
jgi:hypothetical protein